MTNNNKLCDAMSQCNRTRNGLTFSFTGSFCKRLCATSKQQTKVLGDWQKGEDNSTFKKSIVFALYFCFLVAIRLILSRRRRRMLSAYRAIPVLVLARYNGGDREIFDSHF